MKTGKKLPKAALGILVFIILCCALAGLLAPYAPSQMDLQAICAPPSAAHLLGTDTLGRDLFSMILYGGRASIYIGLVSGALSTACLLYTSDAADE